MYDSAPAIFAALGFFLIIIVAVSIGIAVLYILTLRKALSRCAPQNRATSPDSTWFLLIPLFSLVWQFILYPHISESLEREFRQRGLPIEAQPVKTLGLALAVLQVCSIVPYLNFLAGPGALVCFILYWIKISGYSNQLAAAPYPQLTQPPSLPHVAASVAANTQQSAFSPLPPAYHCVACGGSIQPSERFCGTCGKPIA